MQKLFIKNFGPIKNCMVQISEFMVLVGPQSSGKSTISKLVFFFLNVRDEFVNFVLDSIESNKQVKFIYFDKQIKRRFVEFWGPMPSKFGLYIKYEYNNDTWIEVRLDSEKHKYINISFSENIRNEMKHSIDNLRKDFEGITGESSSKLFVTTSNISAERFRGQMIESIRESAKNLFSFKKEILFIPAGRSLLSTLSDQLQFIHPHQLDYPMRVFIERINLTKSFFGKSIDELIKEKHVLGTSSVWFSATRKVETIIKRILKGEYVHDKEGGRLYVDKNTYTKINFASSGQQESIWILLSLFLIVLEKIDALVFVEEPEAHLFPVAQNEIVDLMSFLFETMKTRFVITTHSPYIVSSINNHVYASVIGKKFPEKVADVIATGAWINPANIGGYFVNDGVINNLYDKELNMLRVELIDSASDIVNTEFEKLLAIENGEHAQ